MKAISSGLVLALIFGLTIQGASAAATPVATVNGVAVPAARAEALLAEQRAHGAPDSEQLRKAVTEELVRREVLEQAAKKEGLDKDAEVKTQMDLARQAVLIRAYLQDYVKKNPVTDADVRKEYDRIRAGLGDKEYKVRHILVDTEAEAKSIIQKLQSGEKFDELAKLSKDTGSKDRGGELGWSNPSMFVKPFSDAMVKLQKGKFTTTPVKTDFGYHVIELEDVRDLKAPDFDEVKDKIRARLQQQKVEQQVMDLRGKATVK